MSQRTYWVAPVHCFRVLAVFPISNSLGNSFWCDLSAIVISIRVYLFLPWWLAYKFPSPLLSLSCIIDLVIFLLSWNIFWSTFHLKSFNPALIWDLALVLSPEMKERCSFGLQCCKTRVAARAHTHNIHKKGKISKNLKWPNWEWLHSCQFQLPPIDTGVGVFHWATCKGFLLPFISLHSYWEVSQKWTFLYFSTLWNGIIGLLSSGHSTSPHFVAGLSYPCKIDSEWSISYSSGKFFSKPGAHHSIRILAMKGAVAMVTEDAKAWLPKHFPALSWANSFI